MYSNVVTKLFSSEGRNYLYTTLVNLLMTRNLPPAPKPIAPPRTREQRQSVITRNLQCFINSGPKYWPLAEKVINRYCVQEKLLDEKVWRDKLAAARSKLEKPKLKKREVWYGTRVKSL